MYFFYVISFVISKIEVYLDMLQSASKTNDVNVVCVNKSEWHIESNIRKYIEHIEFNIYFQNCMFFASNRSVFAEQTAGTIAK